jgi:ribose-phosphate pyrophosphokinase
MMPGAINEPKIFSGDASLSLTTKIAASLELPLGDLEVKRFSDGEFQPIYHETVRGCDLFIVQSTYPPMDNLMELLLSIDCAKRASAHYITAVIPYFGLARQDRKDRPRVSIGSRLVADMLSAAGVYRLMTMDLHAPQIQGFFNVPVDHLYGSSVFIPYINSLDLENLVICAPDMGATPRARAYTKRLNAELVICDKHRTGPNQVGSITVIGDVKDRNVIIVDDIVDTAGTMCYVAEALIEKGARSVRAVCTHAVLSGPAIERIENSVLEEMVVTDTIPMREECKKIKVKSVANIFARAIESVYNNRSINSLFYNDYNT